LHLAIVSHKPSISANTHQRTERILSLKAAMLALAGSLGIYRSGGGPLMGSIWDPGARSPGFTNGNRSYCISRSMNNWWPSLDVIIQMFEWNWDSLAEECTNFIGPAGYGFVQASPPQEHIQGPQWWTDYQPVSYIIASKRGNRTQFRNMIETCHSAGVKVIADTIWNHMSGAEGVGIAGSCKPLLLYWVSYGTTTDTLFTAFSKSRGCFWATRFKARAAKYNYPGIYGPTVRTQAIYLILAAIKVTTGLSLLRHPRQCYWWVAGDFWVRTFLTNILEDYDNKTQVWTCELDSLAE
jgi:hypothetical protein